ncbi:MAG: hypothetical protein KDA78_03290 [Planctomycetaceae bacterium]|nr:hypothetical protein [Planctomycetaceae bacterium]
MSSDPAATPNSNAMRELRLRMLTMTCSELGIEASSEYPRVYGVLMDFPISDHTATVVSLCDGNASLYTTSTFGVIGGFTHENVRSAAFEFVKAADNYYEQSTPSTDFSYPSPDITRFYLLTYDGVRMVEGEMDAVSSGHHMLSSLFMDGQTVLTQLRLITESNSEVTEKAPRKEWTGEAGYVNCLLTSMSEGAITTFVIDASQPVPNLTQLISPGHRIREWVESQEFPYHLLHARNVIHVLQQSAKCTGLPFLTRHAELPTFHAVPDGGLVARIFDISIGPFSRSATVSLAPDTDPRVIALQRQADSHRDS